MSFSIWIWLEFIKHLYHDFDSSIFVVTVFENTRASIELFTEINYLICQFNFFIGILFLWSQISLLASLFAKFPWVLILRSSHLTSWWLVLVWILAELLIEFGSLVSSILTRSIIARSIFSHTFISVVVVVRNTMDIFQAVINCFVMSLVDTFALIFQLSFLLFFLFCGENF